ncbi:Leucine-rich repeat-containing protein [Cynara cardunculus var. scolymus]|uniref:Leucine-rich repeat-containing protein n=1 Tax=Cynara cardunculus var. scolymus TaxID=59895 RepID=A0A124SEU9_CYNCS|nr:Leucine-rich repeat-containing protein [Cynara cardunculus var. scolymus]
MGPNLIRNEEDEVSSRVMVGVSHEVKSDYSISRVYDTLRAFDNARNKNCYSIEAKEGQKVLVRVVFNYGNYDGRNSAPTFDLHFDGNFWVTVNTSEATLYEAIYVVKRNVIGVCVARKFPNQVPFISSLEVRGIDPEAYDGRSPDYAIWVPENIGIGLVRLNDTSTIDDNSIDNPPTRVMNGAIATMDTDHFITLSFSIVKYPIRYPMYINWYFTEVQGLGPGEYRSFEIYKDDDNISVPTVPRIGYVSQYFVPDLSVNGTINFSIVATDDSTLPPLINAIEIFSINWGGDPCLPAPYSWDWIVCNDDPRPRVTSLNLNGYSLSGPLPDFRSMDALEIIDLHNNSLTGFVPDFLGDISNLKQLNLADNQFKGSIPRSLLRNSQLNLSYTGNLLLTSSSNKKKTCKLSVILAIAIPVFFIV